MPDFEGPKTSSRWVLPALGVVSFLFGGVLVYQLTSGGSALMNGGEERIYATGSQNVATGAPTADYARMAERYNAGDGTYDIASEVAGGGVLKPIRMVVGGVVRLAATTSGVTFNGGTRVDNDGTVVLPQAASDTGVALYNTAAEDPAGDTEYGGLMWGANVLKFITAKTNAGVARSIGIFPGNGTAGLTIDTAGNLGAAKTLTLTYDAITTSTPGLILQNTTSTAGVGAPTIEVPPGALWKGHVEDSDDNSDHTVEYLTDVTPISAASPSAGLWVRYRYDGGAWGSYWQFKSNGSFQSSYVTLASSSPTVDVSTADKGLTLKGNLAAGTATYTVGTADVILKSTATRTAGMVMEVDNNATLVEYTAFNGAKRIIPQATTATLGTPVLTGQWLDVGAQTYTLGDAAGTLANFNAVAVQVPTVTGAGADRIVTDVANLYAASPSCTTITCTNLWAIRAAGNLKADGLITAGSYISAVGNIANTGGYFQTAQVTAAADAARIAVYVDTNTSGTATTGLGSQILYRAEDSAGNNADSQGALVMRWSDATHASEDATFAIQLRTGGVAIADKLTLDSAGNLAATGTVSAAGGTTTRAVCWKGTVLSYCDSVVAADGSCTCH